MKKSLEQKFLRLLLTLSFLLLCVLTITLLKKTVPFEIQTLLDSNHPIRISYESDNQSFNDEATGWILVRSKSSFEPNTIESISTEIAEYLEFVPGLDTAYGPHNTKFAKIDESGFSLQKFLDSGTWNPEALIKLDSELWKNALINKSNSSFLISLKFLSDLPRKQEAPIIKRVSAFLKTIEKKYPQTEIHLLGAKIASSHFLSEMQFQQKVITPILLFAIGVFLFWCFRSWQILIWNYVVMVVVYACTVCLIILVEGGLGPYSSFALMFAFIVSTSDLIHFFSRMQQIRGNPQFRIQETIRIAKVPCLLTSLTTAAGFLALIVNQNLPIRYFGLYCAFACLFEWVLIFYVLPIALNVFNFKPNSHRFALSGFTHWVEKVVQKNTRTIVYSSMFVLFISAGGAFLLNIDDNFYTKFQNDHPLSKSIDAFSSEFQFVGTVDVIFEPVVADESITKEKYTNAIREIEHSLKENPLVSRVGSLRQVTEDIEKQVVESDKAKNSSTKDYQQSLFNLLADYGTLSGTYNELRNQIRTVVFLKSLKTKDLDLVLNHIDTLRNLHSNEIKIRPSGFSSVRSYINSRVISDFFESFLISFVLIFLCYLYLFRSVKWSMLALIPNAIPLLIVSGAMGLFQVPVDTNLVILICIAFGIVGDNTVHMTYVMKQELEAGFTYSQSLKKALSLLGLALFATSAIFVFCLPVFLLGSLKLFTHVALFLSLAFITAFLSDLLTFPAIQKMFNWSMLPRENNATTSLTFSQEQHIDEMNTEVYTESKPPQYSYKDFL